jgi:hypothetical protein
MDLRLEGKVAAVAAHMPIDGAQGKARMDQ